MSSEQQSCLRFSVEESIWFQKGQEVSELISIALDPDIQIYEQDQYVSIRGALLLSGEYHVNVEDEEEEEEYRPQARVVQEVEEREDGVCAIKHRFPVDITIPKNRIKSLDDIYVAIETFDYSVPSRGCLQLDAELSISGIYGHQQSAPAWEEQSDQPDQPELEAVDAPGVDTKELEYEPMYRDSNSDNEFEEDSYQYYTNEDEEEEEILNQHELDENVEYDNNNAEYVPFEVEARKSPVAEEVEYNPPTNYLEEVGNDQEEETKEEKEEQEDSFTPLYALHSTKKEEPKEEASNIASLLEKRKETQQYEEETINYEENKSEEDPRDENDLSLTKFLAHDNDEEFSRLKICIVQQGESIDNIAERYDVSIQQLIRVNRLSNEDNVNEGQLLYIPVKAVSKP